MDILQRLQVNSNILYNKTKHSQHGSEDHKTIRKHIFATASVSKKPLTKNAVSNRAIYLEYMFPSWFKLETTSCKLHFHNKCIWKASVYRVQCSLLFLILYSPQYPPLEMFAFYVWKVAGLLPCVSTQKHHQTKDIQSLQTTQST